MAPNTPLEDDTKQNEKDHLTPNLPPGSFLALMSEIINNNKLTTKDKKKLLSEVRKVRPALQDRWIYRWVVYLLGGTVVLTVLGGFYIIGWAGKIEIPNGLIALGSAAIGALAGLLANRPAAKEDEEKA